MRRLVLAAAVALAACSNSDPVKRPTNPPPASTTTIHFSTYLGDDLADLVRDVAIDSAGNVFAVGGASSLDLLPGAPTRPHAGEEDAFVAKLDAAGQVVWWTFLGGPGPDRGYAIDIAPNGDLVIGGSAAAAFPVTPGAVLATFQGGAGACDPNQLPSGSTPAGAVCVPSTDDPARDGFVAKLAAADGALVWATYFGSGTFEADAYVDDTTTPNDDNVTDFNDDNDPRTSFVRDVAVDPVTGDVYLTFSFLSSTRRLPDTDTDTTTLEPFNRNLPAVILAALQNGHRALSPALDTGLGSGFDQILAKLSPDGAALPWATFVGGRGSEGLVMLVQLDAQGNPVVLTTTPSVDVVTQQDPSTKAVVATAPIAVGGFDTTLALDGALAATMDFYLAKYALDGPQLWSTYLGASGTEALESGNLAVTPNEIVVAAQTSSGDFVPINAGAFDTTFNGATNAAGFYTADCAIAVVAPDGSALEATTYYGGAFGEGCSGVAVDTSSRIYVTGGTSSPDLPIEAGPFQTERPGPFSAFLAVFSADLSTLLYGGYFGGSGLGNSVALSLRSSDASSGRVVFAGAAEEGYPLQSPARGTVTAPPAHGVLSDVTLGF